MHTQAKKNFSPAVNVSLRSACALLIAAVFLFTFGIDLPSALAAGASNKKEKQDPSLKNLPITELTPEEAIQHALAETRGRTGRFPFLPFESRQLDTIANL